MHPQVKPPLLFRCLGPYPPYHTMEPPCLFYQSPVDEHCKASRVAEA